MTQRRILPVHLALFAVFPVVSLLASNITEVELGSALMPLAAAGAASALLAAILSLILRDSLKAALIVSAWFLLFFSYGHAYNSLVDNELIGGSGRAGIVLAVWAAAGISIFVVVWRTKRDLKNVTVLLNFVAVVMLIMPATSIVMYEQARTKTLAKRATYASAKIPSGSEKTSDPDIYYLIFDRYSSAPVLKDVLNFDNSGFMDYLRGRGFFVAEKSKANYPVTYLSLASSLNMAYHDKARDQKATEGLLQDHEAQRFLKKRGYKYIHYGSAWPPIHHNKFADQSVEYFDLSFDSFTQLLLNTSMAGPVLDKLQPPDVSNRNQVLFQLEALAKSTDVKEKKFVFAHVLLPHSPYLFDANGRPLSAEEQKAKPEEELYKDYIEFANKRISRLIDELLVKSKRPPVIIIQADEGFRYNAKTNAERYRKPGYMDLHYGILNAYYLPGMKASDVVYDSITPVNSLRAVFNAYFSADLEMLKDENYLLLQKGQKIQGFKRVTD